MLVEQKVNLRSLKLHPVEIRGQRLRAGGVQHEIGRRGGDAEFSGAFHQFAAADLPRLELFEKFLCFVRHFSLLG
jgi:hypothetical protein